MTQENTKSYVYRHRRLDTNEIFYVGKGTKSKSKSFYSYKTEFNRAFIKNNRSKWWQNITKKTEYVVEILFDNLSESEASELEIFLISEYKRIDCCGGILVNMTDGGDGLSGYKFTAEQKNKMSESQKGKIVTEETKNKISKSSKGKTLTEKHKENLSKSHNGKKMSNEAIEKMRNYKLNKKVSEETKKLISLSQTRDKHSRATPILCITTGIYYGCLKEACEIYNVNYSSTFRKMNYNKINNSIFIYI